MKQMIKRALGIRRSRTPNVQEVVAESEANFEYTMSAFRGMRAALGLEPMSEAEELSYRLRHRAHVLHLTHIANQR